MKRFRADLHIHTVLSACADLDMSPAKIVSIAKDKNLDLIGITDHNTTLHCKLVKELAEERGLAVLCGTEVTTREEVHCLAYFKDLATLGIFQKFLDSHLPTIPYLPEQFGYQALVDRGEKIIRLIDGYLNVALDQSIDQVEQEVHRLGDCSYLPTLRDPCSVYSTSWVLSPTHWSAMRWESCNGAQRQKSGTDLVFLRVPH